MIEYLSSVVGFECEREETRLITRREVAALAEQDITV